MKRAACIILLGATVTACGPSNQPGHNGVGNSVNQAVPQKVEVDHELAARVRERLNLMDACGAKCVDANGPGVLKLGSRPPVQLDRKLAIGADMTGMTNGYIAGAPASGKLSIRQGAGFAENFHDAAGFEMLSRLASGNSRASSAEVRGKLERFLKLRYLCLVRADTYTAPVVHPDGSTFRDNKYEYEKGKAIGVWFLFDLQDGSLLGGSSFAVSNGDATTVFKAYSQQRLSEKDVMQRLIEDLQVRCTDAIQRYADRPPQTG